MKRYFLILLLLIIPIVFSVEYPTPAKYDWVQCWDTFGVQYEMDDDFYIQDLGVSFIFSYRMYDAKGNFAPDRNNTESFFDERDINYYWWGRYQYDDCSQRYEKLPYTIHHCWVKCEDGSLTDYTTDYTEKSPYEKPFTTQYTHTSFNTCLYDETTGAKTIEFGCTLVMNKYWAENPYLTYKDDGVWEQHPNPYDMGFNDTNIFNYCEFEPEYCESYTQYDVSGCSFNEQYSCSVTQDCPCGRLIESNSCPAYQGDDWKEWGNDLTACSGIIVDSYKINFDLNGDYNYMTKGTAGETDPFDPYDGGDQGGDQEGNDSDPIGSQEIIQQELKLAEKSMGAIDNLQYLSEIVFSFILLVFYILELAIAVFVFGTWIPGIFRSVIEFLRKMGD